MSIDEDGNEKELSSQSSILSLKDSQDFKDGDEIEERKGSSGNFHNLLLGDRDLAHSIRAIDYKQRLTTSTKSDNEDDNQAKFEYEVGLLILQSKRALKSNSGYAPADSLVRVSSE